MEKIYLNSEEYDTVVDAYRSRHGYDDMSDEEKEAFDERLDKVVEKKRMNPILLRTQIHLMILKPSITDQAQINLEMN